MGTKVPTDATDAAENRLLTRSTLQEHTMKSLHGITISALEAWVWTAIRGRNGSPLGSINRRQTVHAFLAKRREPPPIVEGQRRDYNTRMYFYPWGRSYTQASSEERLTPLCGRIRSTSRFPGLSAAYGGFMQGEQMECPNCRAAANNLGITIRYMEEVMNNDPWAAISAYDRSTTLDPVTGT